MTVENLTPEAALQLGLEHAHGVLVTAVEPFGPAAKAGIRVNDVVVAVQNQPVANVPEFHQAMVKHDLKKGIRLTVRTGSIQRFVFIRSGE
jgi:S1-C subfamily serine protease